MPNEKFPKSATPNPAATWVVHCKQAPYDVYVGRDMPRHRLKGAGFGNPFTLPSGGSMAARLRVLQQFDEWVRTQPEILARIRSELRGKVLGCWCSPKPCHGWILADIANDGQPRPSDNPQGALFESSASP